MGQIREIKDRLDKLEKAIFTKKKVEKEPTEKIEQKPEKKVGGKE